MPNPRKPNALKVLQGTDQPCRRNPSEAEPEVAASVGAPASLDDGYARELWDDQAHRLLRLGLMTEVDLQTFAAGCNWWGMYRRANEADDLNAALKAWGACSKVLSAFGMDPSSRAKARSALTRKPKEKDPAAEWAKKHAATG